MRSSILYISSLLFGLTLLFSGFEMSAQGFIPPSDVINEFKSELESSRPSQDTVQVYIHFIKRLIKRGNYSKADSILERSIQDFITLGDSALLADLYEHRAFMYKVQRRFPKSLEDYLWLKDYYQQAENQDALANTYSLLAEYYRALSDYELMYRHLLLAHDIIKENNVSKSTQAYWNSRMASWFTEYGGYPDSVDFYAKRSLALAIESGELYTQALALNELGFNDLHLRKEDSLYLTNLKKSMDIMYQLERYRDYVDVANNFARAITRSERELALQLLETIISLEEENNWYSPLITSLSLIRDQYDYLGMNEEFTQSLFRIYQARIDEIVSLNEIKVNDLALTYTNQLTEQELEIQEQKTQLAEAKAKNNQRAFEVAALVAISLSIITLIIYRFNRKISKKNRQLNLQRDQIQQSNLELEDSLSHQKLLYQELNHRVKNNLSVLTGLIYMQEIAEERDDFKQTLGTLRSRIKSMALAHENLYNIESHSKIDFQLYLEELFNELQNALVDAQKIKTTIQCQDFEFGLQQAIPVAMIINELFTNSIKHGFKGTHTGHIVIKGYFENDISTIEYSDNGCGIPNTGTESTNLGLKLVSLLLEQLDATLKDLSPKTGVHFKIQIPYSNSINNV
ncbi:sensor histidine kinase [Roseivirga sp.]|uniref:sensor histidine kinase n=1 Tax=Roseivirga sp. TaxID=1964215 RepID=UPI003B5294B5